MESSTPSSTAATTAATPKKRRSRLACQRCHNRRVRCDASAQGPPCSHCIASNLASSCRLIESRKVRGERGRFSSRAVERSGVSSTAAQISEDTASASYPPSLTITAVRSDEQRLNDKNSNDNGNKDANEGIVDATFKPDLRDTAGANSSQSRPSRTGTPSEADQWTKIITQDVASVPDGGRVTYLGESWNLSYFLQWTSHSGVVAGEAGHNNGNSNHAASIDNASPSSRSDGHSPSLHIPVPPMDSQKQGYGHSPYQATASASRSSIRASHAAFVLEGRLSAAVQRSLLDAYCNHHLTLYPILCETKLRAAFDAKTVPPLLLATVLYAGAIHAPDAVIYRAGFDTRQACLRKMYLRAKSLFFEEDEEDGAGTESSDSDPLVRVQAAFLLHHMWFRPNSTMDCWTWLSLAIRLAQNMGMHRSTARSSLRDEDRKLWKRIWWSLYSRDSQLASGVGKPLIINDLDCDVEVLTMDDFESHHSCEMRLFAIHQAHLADICKQVMRSRFSPRSAAQSLECERKAALIHDLDVWKASLPSLLTYHPTQDPERTSLEALLLEAMYNTSALFGAMLMHAIRGPAAEHQLSLCMIAMRSMATMYSNAEWVRNIFQALGKKKHAAVHPAVSTRASSPQPVFAKDDSGSNSHPTLAISSDSLAAVRQDGWLPAASSTCPVGTSGTPLNYVSMHDIHGEDGHISFPSLPVHTPGGSTVLSDTNAMDPFNFSHINPDLAYCWEDFVRSENLFSNQYIFDRLSGG
ncbi:hypothetical protein SEUCBS139899_009732 [Sporothrix eucalyptigena]|uniref:Zn(2)-C6 fungal-type domain-containing protein n=1 Tax=Sporothrix eucalyptigena TaxID=1812306 RepID=A0ABP0B390_9PEZI